MKPEGTEEDAEGEGFRYSVKPEGTEEENAEGHLRGRGVSNEGTEEDDTEGQGIDRLPTSAGRLTPFPRRRFAIRHPDRRLIKAVPVGLGAPGARAARRAGGVGA